MVDSHPNVVTVLGFVASFQGGILPGIVTDFFELSDLRRYLEEAASPVSDSVRLKLVCCDQMG